MGLKVGSGAKQRECLLDSNPLNPYLLSEALVLFSGGRMIRKTLTINQALAPTRVRMALFRTRSAAIFGIDAHLIVELYVPGPESGLHHGRHAGHGGPRKPRADQECAPGQRPSG